MDADGASIARKQNIHGGVEICDNTFARIRKRAINAAVVRKLVIRATVLTAKSYRSRSCRMVSAACFDLYFYTSAGMVLVAIPAVFLSKKSEKGSIGSKKFKNIDIFLSKSIFLAKNL
ncbi:MAG: hypothetical protein E7585_04120 [Ruminococcaceae bacterium]|nr:hypothetical protein [Oscillospiraceae bacterium]